MRIVVTGVAGFVGSHFAKQAAAAGHEVVGLYHSDHSDKQDLREQLRHGGVKLHYGNVLDPQSLDAVMEGAQCVCHFAAAFKEKGVDDDYFRRINVAGTVNVLNAAAAAGARRFVLCSTAAVYGQQRQGTIDESAAPHPGNIYEVTKLAAETELHTRAPALGIEHVILRPSAAYGPGNESWIRMLRLATKGRMPLFGRGEGRRQMIYIADLVDAFLLACTTPGAASKTMIIAGPKAVTVRELLDVLAETVDRYSHGPQLPLAPILLLAAATEDFCKAVKIKPPFYRRAMDFYMNDAAFNSRVAAEVLGWRPRTSLREGMGKTVAAYRDAASAGSSRISMKSVVVKSTAG